MPLVGYFDGSESEDLLTLGGFYGCEEPLNYLEVKWIQVLREHHAPEFGGSPYLHMREAGSLQGGFKGWDRNRVRDLLFALVEMIAGFRNTGLTCVSCSVDLADFERARPLLDPFYQKPSAVCVGYCVSALRVPVGDEYDRPGAVRLFFDRNEKFLREIDRAHRSIKRRRHQGWRLEIGDIRTIADGRLSPAMQAADVTARLANRHYCNRDYEDHWHHLNCVTSPDRSHVRFGYGELLKRHGN